MSRRHEYSQHFLRTPQIVAELIGHTNINSKDVVYDLGAGSGVITDVLASKAKEVVAVEVEDAALSRLHVNMRYHENVEIVEQDILEISPTHKSYKIFANPPFSIIAPLVRHFVREANKPEAIFLIVQKQFALKTVVSDNHFTSQLGIQLAPYYESRIRKTLRRTDFTPPPAVDTVLMELKARPAPFLPLTEMSQFWLFVEGCFSDSRQMAKALKNLSVIPERNKPSELKVETWVEMYGNNAI